MTENKKTKRIRQTIPVNILIPPQLKEVLETLAHEEDRTLSNYCKQVLIKHIQESEINIDRS